MSVKFRLAFFAIVAAQIFLLLGMIADREYTLRTGTDVVLQTVPIDPRSLLQGDYAILDYQISRPPSGRFPVGSTVYVILKRGEVWTAHAYVTGKPSDPDVVFIKGKVDRPGHLDFGIGTYFVPEGTGLAIQRAADVKVKVSIDGRGKAVIKQVLVDGKPFEPKRD